MNAKPDQTHKSNKKSRVVLLAFLAVPCMFAFGFALVPLYNLLCDVAGINGKIDNVAYVLQDEVKIDQSRQVQMQFITAKNNDMPWDLDAKQTSMDIRPGEMRTIQYVATNPTDRNMTAQIIPSVTPGAAAQYVHKIQCFCFDAQTLQAGESKEFTVNFFIDPEMPANIEQVTLAYTLFDISKDTIQ